MVIKAEIKAAFNHHNSPLKAIAAIIFDDCFIIKSARLIDGRNGMFVSMPSVRNEDGILADICHPLRSDTKKAIDAAVIDAYHDFMLKGAESAKGAKYA